ncbi:MAG: hypothetical protein WC647_02850 [Desulfomonilaceae bacterium]|jgi:hypothetical protein
MKTKTKLFGSLLLVATITIMPGIVRSQDLSIPVDDTAYQLIEQIQDLELMGRDIQRCYEAEKRTAMIASLSRQSLTDSQLNSELMNRVFSHLVGTSEYERFLKVYRALIRSPGYKQLYSANLCSEYMRLIESVRTRLTTQLKERLRSLAKESSTQLSANSGFSESDPMNIVVRQDPGSAKMAQSEGESLTIEEPQVILTGHGKGKDLRNYGP